MSCNQIETEGREVWRLTGGLKAEGMKAGDREGVYYALGALGYLAIQAARGSEWARSRILELAEGVE